MPQEKPYPLRLDRRMAEKLRYIADRSSRSYNKQIEFIIGQYVVWYEKENGEIQ